MFVVKRYCGAQVLSRTRWRSAQ